MHSNKMLFVCAGRDDPLYDRFQALNLLGLNDVGNQATKLQGFSFGSKQCLPPQSLCCTRVYLTFDQSKKSK